MKRRDFLAKWGLSSLKISAVFLEGEFKLKDADREAAWDLYIELLTRIATQNLLPENGNEKTALESIYFMFPITREILKKHGSECGEFAKIAIPVLNQIMRPFTSKWHKLMIDNAFAEADQSQVFREELTLLQSSLRAYSSALAAMAQVEDMTYLELDGR